MSDTDSVDRPTDRKASFCLAVIGPLLADPPKDGQLQSRLDELAAKSYTHPITGQPVTFCHGRPDLVPAWPVDGATCRWAGRPVVSCMPGRLREPPAIRGFLSSSSS